MVEIVFEIGSGLTSAVHGAGLFRIEAAVAAGAAIRAHVDQAGH